MDLRYVLGSRSPRRRELLAQIVPGERLDIVTPADSEEAGFEGLTTWEAIQGRMREIVRHKSAQVARQCGPERCEQSVLICADTSIIVSGAPGDLQPPLQVLGQPPDSTDRAATLQRWFREYYAGRTHLAATALHVTGPTGTVIEGIATTRVTFRADLDRWLDWYLATDEPRGKAGGYGLQGAASVFVTRIEGSLSNVVGLPLEDLLAAFEELGVLP
jgi:septum formation protein